MRFQIYHGGQLAAVCEYGQEPRYHGEIGEMVRATIEAGRTRIESIAPPTEDIPGQWFVWAASIVYPALSAGALVRWYG